MLLHWSKKGVYCPEGDFYIDPKHPVQRALITHSHSDHVVKGCKVYVTAEENYYLLRLRLNKQARIETLKYGESRKINGIKVTFFPSGHILGASQILLEHHGQRWLITGDFKRHLDPTTPPFQVIHAEVLIMETTFGHPIYRWHSPEVIAKQIMQWWHDCQKQNRPAVLIGYSMGKLQRIQKMITPIGPILVHPIVAKVNASYKKTGVSLPLSFTFLHFNKIQEKLLNQSLVLLPTGVKMRIPSHASVAMASGWFQTTQGRSRIPLHQYFVLSDHADYYQLVQTIKDVAPEKVFLYHGMVNTFASFLKEHHAILAQPFELSSIIL